VITILKIKIKKSKNKKRGLTSATKIIVLAGVSPLFLFFYFYYINLGNDLGLLGIFGCVLIIRLDIGGGGIFDGCNGDLSRTFLSILISLF